MNEISTAQISKAKISTAPVNAALVNEVVEKVRKDGLATVPSVFSEAECKRCVDVMNGLVLKAVKNKTYFGSRTYQVIYNYFVNDPSLFDLIAHPMIDRVMASLIDEDYVLVSPSARNPHIRPDLPEGEATSGLGWHVDARVADTRTGDLYRPSQAYYTMVALEPFAPGNSATLYVPGSHLLYKKPTDRNAKLDHSIMEAKTGSVVVFDAALWHRAGIATDVSRWSTFNQYGPWFMKPFFRFSDNYTHAQLRALPLQIQKLLHMCSLPPRDAEGPRRVTVTKTPSYD